MLHTLRRRLRRTEDEGFTLIELMVVVLIIAILLAIAIPTVLGARSRAQNRAAESQLRNALTAEKTVYTDNQQYTATTGTLATAEPSLNWQAWGTAFGSTPGNQVDVEAENTTADTNNELCLSGKSASGNYYGILDVGQADGTWTAGTFYYSGTAAMTCTGAQTDETAAGQTAGSTFGSTTAAANW